MQNFMSLARSWAGDFTLRLLVYATGAVATATGVYYFIKKRRGNDPMQTEDISSPDLSLRSDEDALSVTHSDGAVPEDSLAEAEQTMEINNQLENMETNTQVGDINLNNSYLMSKVNTLEDCVQLLDEELAQTRMRCNEIMTELEQEQEAHRILESHCEEMKTTLKTCDELLKVCEGEVKDHSILKVSLAEVERKYKQAMESNAHLENETFDLMSKMGILQSSMQEMTNKCAEATKNYEKTKHILEYVLATANEREKTLNLEIDLLQASLAEAERHYEFLVTDYYESVDTQNNLRAELSTLHRKVGDLQGALRTVTRECEQLRSMRDKLSLMSTTILNDHELELQAHGTLKEQHVELLTERKREQACLAEAERKYKEVMESNAQLEKEKSDLQSQVNTLQGSVQQLKEEHSETRTKCDEMPVSLAAADKLQEEAMQSKAKMKNEILDLKYHLHTLRDSVRELEIMLSDGEMHCDAIKQETEQEREAYRILKMQYKKMKETIQRFRELLMIYHTKLGFEEPQGQR